MKSSKKITAVILSLSPILSLALIVGRWYTNQVPQGILELL